MAESQISQDIVHKIYEDMYASWLNFVKPRKCGGLALGTFLASLKHWPSPQDLRGPVSLLYIYLSVNSGHVDCTTTATDTRQREVQLEAIFYKTS